MARLRFYENMFEDKFVEVDFDEKKSLETQVSEFSFNHIYNDYLVECYDPDTGKTFFAPLVENQAEDEVLITINGNSIEKDYKPAKDDIINVVYLPTDWNWKAVLGGAGIGAVLGFIGLGFITGGWSWIAAGMGALVGLIAGGFIGYFVGKTDESSYSSTSAEKGTALPDVRGAENQEITGNVFPYLFGKHQVSPYILGQPYTTYSGENGEDAYIQGSYIVGYAPLMLTDFKLGDYRLTDNKDKMLRGLLKGYSTTTTDDGDIKDFWENNDISLEIIQQKDDKDVWYGDIYPSKVVDNEVNANSLYVCDKSITDIANVAYKGTSFPNNFRTNTVIFSESCPKKITVTLDFPSGLYSSHSHTSGSSSEVLYEKIPLWFALEWRAYNTNNRSSCSNGEDSVTSPSSIYDWHSDWTTDEYFLGKKATYDAAAITEDYMAHKGNTFSDVSKDLVISEYAIGSSDYTKFYLDAFLQLTNFKQSSKPIYSYEFFGTQVYYCFLKGTDKRKVAAADIQDYTTGYFTMPGGNFVFAINDKADLYLSAWDGDIQDFANEDLYVVRKMNHVQTSYYCDWITLTYFSYEQNKTVTEKRYIRNVVHDFNVYRRTAVYKNTKAKQAQSWIGKTLYNFAGYSGKTDNHDGTSEMRVSFTREFTKEECQHFAQCSSKGEFLDDGDNTIKGVEVRLVRVSPCYLNQTTSTSTDSAYQYTDTVNWKSIVTECFDEDELVNNGNLKSVPVLSEEDMRKVCCVSIKAKADSTGTVENSIGKLNCIAQSFSPIWHEPDGDATDHEYHWLPEGVEKQTVYYGFYDASSNPCDRSSKSTITKKEVTKSDYEKARQQGYNWIAFKNGSNYQKLISDIVLSTWTTHNDKDACFLQSEANQYLETNSASAFMLSCVGPQNGPVAMGYEDIDLLKMATAFNFNKDVTDGSTYTVATTFNGESYKKGDLAHVKYEANGYIYNSKKLEELLKDIAITCRSCWTYDERGKILLVPDMPTEIIKGVINQQNTLSGTNTYSYSELPAGLEFTFSDENDGYEQNNLYCWADGQSIENYQGQVESYSINYVTNPAQIWSLGRFVLASKCLQREIISREIGPEGYNHSLGDVMLVQSNELLLGGGSGRVIEVIQDDNFIYGVVTDTPYKFTAETEVVDNVKVCKQGVTIMQQRFNGKSKSVTFRLATNKTTVNVIVDGETRSYTLKKGMTNVVLFDTIVNKYTGSDASYSQSVYYSIKPEDIILYGNVNEISQKYKITKIKVGKENTFTETLMPYYDELYNYGAPLPTFKSTVSMPAPAKDPVTLSNNTTITDVQNQVLNISSNVADSAASSASTDLKDYIDNTAIPNANTYADGVASTAQATAISTAASDATTKANNAKDAAISAAASDATTKASNAETAAKIAAQGYASTAESNAKTAAQGYADTAKETAVSEANKYVDETAIPDVKKELNNNISNATQEAKDYADDIVAKKTIRTLTSLTETGVDKEVALYNGWFYKYVDSKWQPVAREDYLGTLDYFPDVTDSTTAQFFLYTGTAKTLQYYLTTTKGNLTTTKGKILVTVSGEPNYIYYFDEQWRKVRDRNDYRYLIATNDLLANNGEISPNLDKNVQDRADKAEANANGYTDEREVVINNNIENSETRSKEYTDEAERRSKDYAVAVTPKFLGTLFSKTDIPSEPSINNYFLWNGDDVTTYVKGTLYKWTGLEWSALSKEDSDAYTYYMTALQGLEDTGSTTQVGAFMSVFCQTLVAQQAFIEELQAQVITLTDNGKIQGQSEVQTTFQWYDGNGNWQDDFCNYKITLATGGVAYCYRLRIKQGGAFSTFYREYNYQGPLEKFFTIFLSDSEYTETEMESLKYVSPNGDTFIPYTKKYLYIKQAEGEDPDYGGTGYTYTYYKFSTTFTGGFEISSNGVIKSANFNEEEKEGYCLASNGIITANGGIYNDITVNKADIEEAVINGVSIVNNIYSVQLGYFCCFHYNGNTYTNYYNDLLKQVIRIQEGVYVAVFRDIPEILKDKDLSLYSVAINVKWGACQGSVDGVPWSPNTSVTIKGNADSRISAFPVRLTVDSTDTATGISKYSFDNAQIYMQYYTSSFGNTKPTTSYDYSSLLLKNETDSTWYIGFAVLDNYNNNFRDVSGGASFEFTLNCPIESKLPKKMKTFADQE